MLCGEQSGTIGRLGPKQGLNCEVWLIWEGRRSQTSTLFQPLLLTVIMILPWTSLVELPAASTVSRG